MYLSQAVDDIRERSLQKRISKRSCLWAAIVKQLARSDGFDGEYADIVTEIVRAFLNRLDNATIIELWKQTDTGMRNASEDETLQADCLLMELETDLFQEVIDVACREAQEIKCRKSRHRPTPRQE